jgi:tagatose 1,6-diphosphate aldolase GatY/KbaY
VIARGTKLLRRARAEGWAITAFSIYNLEGALAVRRAAEDERLPALIQAGSSAFRYGGLEPLAGLAIASAEAAEVEIGVHLDHATEPEEVHRCIARGYSSVMYDGSALPLEENIERTRAVVAQATRHGVWVEGELASFAGDEDVSSDSRAGNLTDPAEAERYVAETGVAALAVAIGNVHGIPAAPVRLDLERLAEIAARVPIPLVLHGASGLPDADVRVAIELGVAKLNVNTELRRAFRAALLEVSAKPPPGDAIAPLLEPAIEAMRQVARRKLRAFGPAREGEAA